jgi:hypothetical protein
VDYLTEAQIWDPEVIRTRAQPLQPEAGIAVLRGSLAPGGAIIKPAAASPHLLRHRGRALVFDSVEDFHARIDDPDLDVDADSVLVLRGCGPRGYPGMPEVANMPLPTKLLQDGVRDMVRICDGRMSGTAYGTVVLHVTPEAADDGPLARVRTGDMVVLDVDGRRLDVDVPAAELAARRPGEAMTERLARPGAAGSSCTCAPSWARTPAPTSTSSSAAAATRSPASRTDPTRADHAVVVTWSGVNCARAAATAPASSSSVAVPEAVTVATHASMDPALSASTSGEASHAAGSPGSSPRSHRSRATSATSQPGPT